MSRVVFILDDEGRLQVLEINTIPGFTWHSLLPMAAARVGIGFDELVNRLVSMTMRREVNPAEAGLRRNHGEAKQEK